MKPTKPQPWHALTEQLRGLEHQIVRGLAAGLSQRPRSLEAQFSSGRQAQSVGAIGERDHTFKVVIAVDPPANHTQSEVDLGMGCFNQRLRNGFDIHFSIPGPLMANVQIQKRTKLLASLGFKHSQAS